MFIEATAHANILRDGPAELDALFAEMDTIQKRLREQKYEPGDVDRLRDLAHRYMNQLHSYIIARELPPPPGLTLWLETRRLQSPAEQPTGTEPPPSAA